MVELALAQAVFPGLRPGACVRWYWVSESLRADHPVLATFERMARTETASHADEPSRADDVQLRWVTAADRDLVTSLTWSTYDFERNAEGELLRRLEGWSLLIAFLPAAGIADGLPGTCGHTPPTESERPE